MVLETSTVRYSSPLRFNDPFDVQAGLHLELDVAGLHETLLGRLQQLVLDEREPVFIDPDAPGAAVVQYGRGMRAEHGFPLERAREVLAPGFSLVEQNLEWMRTEYQRHVWEDVLPALRVFSVAERLDNLLMWAHYADEHRGAVFEFRVSAEIDNPLCVAAQVTYHATPPSLFTQEEFLGHWFGTGSWDRSRTNLTRYVLAKGSAWRHEREWRVWFPTESASGEPYEDVSLCANELAAVYIGCRIRESDRDHILRLLAARHAGTRAFRARRPVGRFELEYDAI